MSPFLFISCLRHIYFLVCVLNEEFKTITMNGFINLCRNEVVFEKNDEKSIIEN